MKPDHQKTIFEIIKRQTQGKDSLGNIVGEILSISQDAVYRRFRGETHLSIFELEKLCQYFEISLDSLFEINKSKVLFDFQPLSEYDYKMDLYFDRMLEGLRFIQAQEGANMIVSALNFPVLQCLNFPHLLRFKLFFWAKTHLQVPEYKTKKFKYEKFDPDTFQKGFEALSLYNRIPTKEMYDPELYFGFMREIYYYFESDQFEDPGYAISIFDQLEKAVNHMEAQTELGRKFAPNSVAPASGNDFEVYLNGTFNSNTTIYYQTKDHQGLYLAHNMLNSIHTNDKVYIEDSLSILNKQMSNSSIISINNDKERKMFYKKVRKNIEQYKKKIELALEDEY